MIDWAAPCEPQETIAPSDSDTDRARRGLPTHNLPVHMRLTSPDWRGYEFGQAVETIDDATYEERLAAKERARLEREERDRKASEAREAERKAKKAERDKEREERAAQSKERRRLARAGRHAEIKAAAVEPFLFGAAAEKIEKKPRPRPSRAKAPHERSRNVCKPAGYLTMDEALEYIRKQGKVLTKSGLWQAVAQGRLEVYRVGRWAYATKPAIRAYIKAAKESKAQQARELAKSHVGVKRAEWKGIKRPIKGDAEWHKTRPRMVNRKKS